jgi:hypothetical protein
MELDSVEMLVNVEKAFGITMTIWGLIKTL